MISCRFILKGVISVLTLTLIMSCAQAQSGMVDNSAARCSAVGNSDFSEIQDAPTQIIETKLVDRSDVSPAYCEISGYISPSFAFLLRLPTDNWNGKLVQVGSGGAAGSYVWLEVCEDIVRRGYACITSDGGHRSTTVDFKWAYNNPQAPLDTYIRAPHVTALAGKRLVESYYSKAPDKMYFVGCSAGGIQGLNAAQRFPWDYDGIFALGPALSFSDIMMNLEWGNRAYRDSAGTPIFSQADIELLHKGVVAKCDLNDGVTDGVIGDPRSCDFNPVELRCTGEKSSRCLSARQVEAVARIYKGPVTSKGEQIAQPTFQKGSEMSWPLYFSDSFNLLGHNIDGKYRSFAEEWFRYGLLQPNPGPAWKVEQFDFDRDYRRIGLGQLIEPLNPDLRAFKRAGGKLLMATGWSDPVEGVLRTVDYYEAAERLMGGRAITQQFLRLFVVPGADHCGRGDGPFAIDYLGYLEKWVEQGIAPDHLIGVHYTATDDPPGRFAEDIWPFAKLLRNPKIAEFSRPIYPYPTQTRYLGTGDPKDAASFGPVEAKHSR